MGRIFFSKKITQIPYLDMFFSNNKAETNCVVGWGHKETSEKARDYARKNDLPYVALEDGFLRSLDLGCRGVPPLSLVLDHTGIYYDASAPSDLENLLEQGGWETAEMLERARKLIQDIVRLNLSKYNQAPEAEQGILGKADPNRPRILLVDQTFGDASVKLGMASETDFQKMKKEALRLFPNGRFFIKTHPDVIAGKKQGYLYKQPGETFSFISQDAAPLSLLRQADAVFCVTSQLGFEALMLGLPVYCFGMPFYAGWGLTKDFQKCSRRTRKRTLEEVVAASLIMYARYVDPVRGQKCEAEETVLRLALQRQYNEQNRGFHACVGYSHWKHTHAKSFLQSTGASFRFYSLSKAARAIADAAAKGGDVVAWSSKCTDGKLEQQCSDAGVPLLRMEDGFIRSIGLGSDFYYPYSLVVDQSGIYYDPSQPSDLEKLLNSLPDHPDHDALCRRAAAIRHLIVEKGLTKYNVGSSQPPNLSFLQSEERILLVPGQVEDDASVKRGGGRVQSNLDLLRAVRRDNPDACILYKPHPDVESGNRRGTVSDEEILNVANHIIRDVRMDRLLSIADEIHTLTSLTGFEALLRNIPVTTYGGPFYAGWGLTHDKADNMSCFARRTARLTLDELAAGVLLLYPRYYDWPTQSFVSAEDVCYRLSSPNREKNSQRGLHLFALLRQYFRRRNK
ncbi:MAG: capsular polysaccharide biosynthesis protein [Desulfovibrionaceae bacterium]|nr:capsular polysaccharide biosynthesis protein [Desulfovibrionaceae bacterium]